MTWFHRRHLGRKRSASPSPLFVARDAARSRFVPRLVHASPLVERIGDAPLAPCQWSYDWSVCNPLDDPRVLHWLAMFLSGVVLPASWLPVVSLPLVSLDPVAAEDRALDAAFVSLTVGAKAVGTLAKYRIPFLKMMLWLALRNKPVAPPLALDVGRYMTAIAIGRRNKTCCEVASNALSFVCWLNSWLSLASSPACSVPISAARRAFGAPTSKAEALESWMVAAIAKVCCTADSPDHLYMFGSSLIIGFILLCRYDDLIRLRWDVGYFEDHGTHLRFYVEKRKTDQNYGGSWLDIPQNPPCANSFGISAAILAREMLRRANGVGAVLRRIEKRGVSPHLGYPFFPPSHEFAGSPRWMSRSDYVDHLRSHLISDCGLSPERAALYSGHSARAGGATELVLQKVPEAMIKELAGVVGANWVATYDRKSLKRRLSALSNFGF